MYTAFLYKHVWQLVGPCLIAEFIFLQKQRSIHFFEIQERKKWKAERRKRSKAQRKSYFLKQPTVAKLALYYTNPVIAPMSMTNNNSIQTQCNARPFMYSVHMHSLQMKDDYTTHLYFTSSDYTSVLFLQLLFTHTFTVNLIPILMVSLFSHLWSFVCMRKIAFCSHDKFNWVILKICIRDIRCPWQMESWSVQPYGHQSMEIFTEKVF